MTRMPRLLTLTSTIALGVVLGLQPLSFHLSPLTMGASAVPR